MSKRIRNPIHSEQDPNLQREERYRELVSAQRLAETILDKTTEGIVVCDDKGRVVVANQVARRLAGSDPQSQMFDQVFPLRRGRGETPWHGLERRKESRLGPTVTLDTICDGMPVRRMEVNLPRGDGFKFHLLLSAGPLVGAQGNHLGCIVTMTDVTQLRLAEAALHEAEGRFSRLAESNLVGIIVLEGDSIRQANGTFLTAIGRTRAELGLNWRAITPPEAETRLGQKLDELIARGVIAPFELELLHASGQRVPVSITAILLEASPLHWVGFVVNQQDRKRAEATVHLFQERFTKAFQASPDGLVISRRADGKLIEVNESFEKMTGYRRAELIGRSSLELGLFGDPADRARALDELQRRGALRDYSMQLKHKSGQPLQVSLSMEKINIGGEEMLLTILRDVSELKQTRAALEDAYDKLESRVHERTAQLSETNQALQAEIAERSRVENELRENRALFESLLESAPDAIITVDGEGRMVLVNSQTEKMFGFRREELLGQSIEILMPGRLRDTHILHRMNYVRAPSTRPMGVGLELWGRRKDGTEFPVEISLSPVQTKGSTLVASIIRDITDRKRADQALKEQARRLQEQADLIELAHDTIIVRDTDNRIIYWNHGAEETFGWTKQQALGQVIHSLLQTQFPEPLERIESQLLTQGRWEGELVHIAQDGRRIVVASRQVLQRNERGAPRAVLEINRDITPRKLAEEHLRQSEERFRTLVQQVHDYAIIGLDAEGRVVSWNDGAERLNGYRAEEIIGKPISVFFTPEDVQRGRPQKELADAATQGHYEEESVRVRRDGSRYWADVVVTALRDSQGNLRGFSKVIRDVSARKEAQEQIQKLNAELERRVNELGNLNQELESFSYSVSHDLRAPLRAIAGFSQALAEDYDDRLDEQGRDYTRRIIAAAQRLTQLIDDLLTLSRVTRSEMNREKLDLSALAESIASQLQSTQPERRVHFTIQPGLRARGDAHLLNIALENLLANAWKFTSKLPDARIEFGTDGAEGKKTIYFVRDNGAGFDMAFRDKLFGAFQRLHSGNEFPGTGIGLATVQRIIRRHGGRVWAQGEVGRGATFYFTLE